MYKKSSKKFLRIRGKELKTKIVEELNREKESPFLNWFQKNSNYN